MRSALVTSLAIHTAIACGVAALFLRSTPTPEAPIEVRVIEAPKPAPNLDLTQNKKPEPKPKEIEARKVFGVSRKAVTSDEGLAVKAGNTIAKEPDNEKLRPSDADSLPIPTDEYLVSEMPQPLGSLKVAYPPDAKAKGRTGSVVMSLLIDETGRVRDAVLVRGAGGDLDEAALAAVRELRFRPAKVGDKAVAVRIQYTHRFILESA